MTPEPSLISGKPSLFISNITQAKLPLALRAVTGVLGTDHAG